MATPTTRPGTDDRTDVRSLLRTCVQCGLCLPHCATWLATGNEVQSPRGRLVLLEKMYAEPDTPAPFAFLAAFDQCIGCRACETACPSGVPFSLLERGMDLAAGQPGTAPSPAVPRVVLHRMDSTSFLTRLDRLVHAARTMVRFLAGRTWRRRLEGKAAWIRRGARLLGTVPRAPRADRDLEKTLVERGAASLPGGDGGRPDARDKAGRLVFFRGCANAGFLPDTSRRLRELLTWSGFEVRDPEGQECCGALASHTGRPGRAAALATANAGVLVPMLDGPARVVVEAAGCGHELKRQRAVGDHVVDAVELLAGIELPPLGRLDLRVALHDPCHARHGQGLVAEPRTLLARLPGVTVLEPHEAEVCCGSGGAWGLRYPDVSDELGRRKAACLAATGADVIVTSNPGCLGQVADGLAFMDDAPPILPLTDLIWYAAVLGR